MSDHSYCEERNELMTGRHVRVGITPVPDPDADVSLAQLSLRERLVRWLFGPLTEMTLIVPGQKVEDVTVTTSTTGTTARAPRPCRHRPAWGTGRLGLVEAMRRHPAGKAMRCEGGEAA